MKNIVLALAATLGVANAWMPWDRDLEAFNQTARTHSKRAQLPSKIRGVNLGGWMVSERWMMTPEFRDTMGCGNACSEFDCVSNLGQSAADTAFQKHYSTWITTNDIQRIHDVGLNTIRIPVGYWIKRDLVSSSEHFPQGQLSYLDSIIQKAADLGMFVVIDLHGAPGAQKTLDPFTGQCLPTKYLPGFFTQDNYNRAYNWLDWMTTRIHNTPSYAKTVGIIEVVNEPQRPADSGGQPQNEVNTFTQQYYPGALNAVRQAEKKLGISSSNALHVQFMDKLWSAGDPKSNLPSDSAIFFDDHNYVYVSQGDNAKQADYMYKTCYQDDRLSDGDTPKAVGEWSLTVNPNIENTNEFDPHQSQNVPFYKQWFTAQQRNYEKTNGWIFWTWKTQLNNYRWDYSDAVSQGIIPNSAAGLDKSAGTDACASYFGK